MARKPFSGSNRGPKRHKYHAKKTVVDGITFPSLLESQWYSTLRLLERQGEISNLRLQVPFDLHAAGGAKVCKYTADFVFIEDGVEITADSKGILTECFRLKKKWMKAEYGIDIRILTREGL